MNNKDLGAGHMSDVDVAAFDLIFYLHHWYLPCLGVEFDLIKEQ